MAIVLDADVIIRGEKGSFDLKNWLESRSNDQFAMAAVTVAELWHGIERAAGTQKAKRLGYLQTLLGFIPIVPYTTQTAYQHARIWAELESKGKMTGYYDIIVAATALERGDSVATFNKRHFDLVQGLKSIEPS